MLEAMSKNYTAGHVVVQVCVDGHVHFIIQSHKA